MKNIQRPYFRHPNAAMRPSVGASLLTAAMALSGLVHAENAPERGLISLKHLDYQDSQPGDSRIHIDASAVTVMAPIAGEWSVSGTLTSDGISGASPAYHTTGLTPMHDKRHAIDSEITRYFPDGTLSFGASVSTESDYLSRSVSVTGTKSSEDKNTTWTAGIGLTSDRINPTNGIVVDESKQVTDLLVGVTQVLTSVDIVQLSLGHSWGRGYFSDPYKILDNRPRVHDHSTLMARWNHHFVSTDGTVRFSYRYYSDSGDIKAHTLGAEYVQPLAEGWTVTPLVRLYSQSAANFYIDAEAVPSPFAPSPPADASYYSGDQRVSAFGAHTLGLKLAKKINPDWLVDIKLENYGQRAAWRLFGTGSPYLAAFNYRSVQLGVSRQF
ncbi:MAG: DUF3570 domain-containing protein [Proteobacteria bacterium]|nr:DUF3570 domain-containing protein [Pseudomonadota bacterium]